MRRFFALLAILTGLAAVAAPTSAAPVNDVCQQISSGEINSPSKAEQCACAAKQRGDKRKTGGIEGCKQPKPIVVYIPTVQVGIDRAYE